MTETDQIVRFAETFYDHVMKRILSYTNTSFPHGMPKILVLPKETDEEAETRITANAIHSIRTGTSLEEDPLHADAKLVPSSIVGNYNSREDIIRVNPSVTHYEIAHEVMHAVRRRIKGMELVDNEVEFNRVYDQEGFLQSHIVEFFGELSDLVIREEFPHIVPEDIIRNDINAVGFMHSYFKNGLESWIDFMFAAITQSSRPEELAAVTAQVFYNGLTYFSLITDLAQESYTDIFCDLLELKESIELDKGTTSDLVNQTRARISSLLPGGKTNLLLYHFDSTSPYHLARLTINSHSDYLKEHWPYTFTFSPEQLQEQFFKPIIETINVLRHDSAYDHDEMEQQRLRIVQDCARELYDIIHNRLVDD